MAAKKGVPSIEELIDEVNKKYGTDAIVDMQKMEGTHPSVSTGFANVDDIIGIGGLPKGRFIEMYGPQHSGKSTLAMHAAAEVQALDGLVVYVDFEHSFDPRYATKLGMNCEDRNLFLLTQPSSLEEGMSIAARFIREGLAAMVIIDSIAAGTPQAELEGDTIGGNRIGLHSLVWANVLKQITHIVHQSDCIVIAINQVRTKIGITFGSSEDTPGGNAWKHVASLRIKLVKTAGMKGKYQNELGIKEDIIVGTKVRVEISKNKMARPFRSTELTMRHGEGFDLIYPLIEEAELKNVIVKGSTGWYQWGEKDEELTISQRGIDKMHGYLKENPDELRRLQKEVSAIELAPGEVDF